MRTPTAISSNPLKPRGGAVNAILLAELCLKHSGFFPRPPNLKRDDKSENQQPRRMPKQQEHAGDDARAKNINRIADSGIETSCDQLPRLR